MARSISRRATATPAPPDENTDAIFALDLTTGAVKWHVQTLNGDIWPCLRVSKQVLDPAGNCVGLKSEGADIDFTTAPILVHGKNKKDILVAGRKDGAVFGVDPDSGKILWNRRISHSPDPYIGNLYFGLMAQDGRVFVPTLGTSGPYLADFVSSPDDGLYALDAYTGKTVWAAPVANDCDRGAHCVGLGFAPIGVPGVIFAGAMDGIVRAYDAASGRVVWHFDTARAFTTLNGEVAKGGAVARSGILIADGMVYVNSGYAGAPGNVLLAFSANGQ